MTRTRSDSVRAFGYLIWIGLVNHMSSSRRAYLTGFVMGSLFTALTISLLALLEGT